MTTSTRESTTRAWISADIWRQDGAICSKNRKIVPYHGSARIPRLAVSVPDYGSCCDLNLGESLCISTFFLLSDSSLNLMNGFDLLFWSFLNGVTLKTGNLKTLAFRFREDGKHFQNVAFPKRWRHDNHVISLREFSSNTNPNDLVIGAFLNCPGEVWSENIRSMCFQSKPSVFKFLRLSVCGALISSLLRVFSHFLLVYSSFLIRTSLDGFPKYPKEL